MSIRVTEPPSTDGDSSEVSLQAPASSLSNREEHLNRALTRVGVAASRGACSGLLIRGGLEAFSALLGRPRRPGATTAVQDTVRFATFLASLCGSYVAVDEGIAALFGRERTSRWRGFAAGLAAGPSLLLAGEKHSDRHNSLAVYVLIRGITLLVRTGNRDASRRWLFTLLWPTRFKHGDTALMCLAASQILYSFIGMPHTLPNAYIKFIQRHAGKPVYTWAALREMADRQWGAGPAPGAAPPARLAALQHTPLAGFSSRVPCHMIHPGEACVPHAVRNLPRAYVRALQLYLPVYVLPALLIHREKMLKRPVELMGKMLTGAARSSLFLATYVTLVFLGTCTAHQATGTTTPLHIALGVSAAGLATLVEKPSRRMELAHYCLARAAESCCLCLYAWGWVPQRLAARRLDVACFSLACGAIMHCYSDGLGKHREVLFRSKYLNMLDFVFGSDGVQAGAISHLPSNSDLLISTATKAGRAASMIRTVSTHSLSGLAAMVAPAFPGAHPGGAPPSPAGSAQPPHARATFAFMPPSPFAATALRAFSGALFAGREPERVTCHTRRLSSSLVDHIVAVSANTSSASLASLQSVDGAAPAAQRTSHSDAGEERAQGGAEADVGDSPRRRMTEGRPLHRRPCASTSLMSVPEAEWGHEEAGSSSSPSASHDGGGECPPGLGEGSPGVSEPRRHAHAHSPLPHKLEVAREPG